MKKDLAQCVMRTLVRVLDFISPKHNEDNIMYRMSRSTKIRSEIGGHCVCVFVWKITKIHYKDEKLF